MTYEQAQEELMNWYRHPDDTNFHCLLYHLIAKADPENRERLRLGFPEELRAYEEWMGPHPMSTL